MPSTTTLGPIAARYLSVLGASLRNDFYKDSLDAPVSGAELEQACRVIAEVAAEFSQERERLRASEPVAEIDDIAVRYLLLDPEPEAIARFLRCNAMLSHTLLGPEALRSLGEAVETVVGEGVPGDLMECGVFRGGAAVYMRGVLAALGVEDRKVWLADSFQGLPEPPRTTLKDAAVHAYLREVGSFRASLEQVRGTFAAYDLLDDQVDFLPGWFEQTLPSFSAPLALLRCDGDWYESTRTILESLYDQVSPGGFVIIDDYSPMFGAVQAVDEFRLARGIEAPLLQVKDGVHYWRKGSAELTLPRELA